MATKKQVILTLDERAAAKLEDQILIVLADYQSMNEETLKSEGTRVDIKNRIMANLKLLARKS